MLRNFFKHLSIKMQLLILAIATGIIVVSLILVVYFEVTAVIAENNREYTSDMTFRIKQDISSSCDLFDRVLTSVAYNDVIQSYMMGAKGYAKVELFYQVNNFLSNMQEMNKGIIDFVFLSDYGNSYYLKGENASVRKIIEGIRGSKTNYYTKMEALDYNNQTRNCIMVISTVYSINQQKFLGEKIGTAAIVFDASALGIDTSNGYKKYSTDFYLLDRENNIYSGSNQSGDQAGLLDNPGFFGNGNGVISYKGEKFVVSSEKIPETGGKIISVISERRLYQGLAWVRRLVLIILFVSGLLLSVLFISIINNILHPLRKFMNFITSLKTGNIKDIRQNIDLEGNIEMGVMAQEFNSLLDEIDNLTHSLLSANSRIYETELEKKRSELAYLKSQINPHFIYNTLETLKGMAVEEEAFKTMGMAKALGHIFRYSVKGSDIVTLREELDIVKSYVQIQTIRFNKRFDVFYEFSDDLLDLFLPKMLLQPIVENAVSHGLEGRLENGRLSIGGKLDGAGCLNIWVIDNGAGINKETLMEIQSQLEENQASEETFENAGIGLRNVHNRIQLIYGKEYGITIDSMAGVETKVILKIPARRFAHV